MIIPQKRRYAALWTPLNLGATLRWMLTETGIVLTGSNITSWTNDASADSLTGFGFPVVATSDGRDVAVFTAGDVLTGIDRLSGTSPELDIFMLVKAAGGSGVHVSVNGDSSTPRNGGFVPLSGTIFWDDGGPSAPNRISIATTSTSWNPSTNWGIANLRNTVSGSAQEIYVNAELEANDATGHTVATTGGLRIGTYLAQNAVGTLAACIVCDSYLSLSDRQKVEGWMAHYINQLGMLPLAHPYKSVPPQL